MKPIQSLDKSESSVAAHQTPRRSRVLFATANMSGPMSSRVDFEVKVKGAALRGVRCETSEILTQVGGCFGATF